ncbi:Nn.00g112900.m01.CDS01, partial [Neocucurbitaria sp. VM-36]
MPPRFSLEAKRAPCPYGSRCKFGTRCRFSHDKTIPVASSSGRAHRQPSKDIGIEPTCREWTYMIPRSTTAFPRFGSDINTKDFFQIGWNLVESGDTGTRQYVITKLGAETGLAMIKNMTDIMDANEQNEAIVPIFKDRTLPFYRTISHPDVLASLILETPVDSIYTFLFGPSGRRGLSVFLSTATALRKITLKDSQGDEDVSNTAISSSLMVLDRLIEINQSAQVIEGFTTIVERISDCFRAEAMGSTIQQCLTRIRRRLNMGSSLPLASTQSMPKSTLPATFELNQDLPGDLSTQGIRHDNDHATIDKIKILPTAEEITSRRQQYLPLNDSTHHHLPGLAGLLDRQFRLLREDTVGQLRDAVREEMGKLENPTLNAPTNRSRQGVRRLVYHNVRFSRMCIDRKRGLQVVAKFDQPPQIKNKAKKQREEWWKNSKLLQVDSLVCFVSSNGKIIFFSVCDPIPLYGGGKNADLVDGKMAYDLPSLFKDAAHASVLLSLAQYKQEDIVWISTHMATSRIRQSLVEFPGVLLPSFEPILQALQKMSRKLNLPFADIIAPESGTPATSTRPPAYAAKHGFSFNLDVLAGVPLTLRPGQSFDFRKLEAGSTLDEAQQHAVIQALSTALALIQGPPGTGKSYTGVAIIKALLHNRNAADLGPIICVCYTNHALDQLLEHLVKDGVKQIIRLGSRSKSDLLQSLTLYNVAKEAVPTKTEKHDKWEHSRDIGDTASEIKDILSGLNEPKSWTNISAHLQKTHGRHFKELFGKGVDQEGFQEVRGKKFRVVESWLRGAPQKLTSNRPLAQLSAISLREMSTLERSFLHKHWIEQRSAQLTNDLIHALDSYHESKSALDKCHKELDLRCLREAHIIGVTTSGLARNIELLQRVRAKVMICEEAGEVLEAHTLTAFLPGVQHAILIGDHEQLRPQINTYELQHDNPQGKRYSLDISLFERLVRPQTGDPQVPLSTLKTQRRMHPSISELVRVPLYPHLQDHSSVSEYPEVDGMRDRLYWLNHQEKEDAQPVHAVSLSKTNTFEVEMTAALVSHLVRQGTYGSEDIAVLTPYLGQLQKIKKRLAGTFEIVVGDRDQEELEAQGLRDEPDTSAVDGQGQVQVQKTTLLNALRVATVDNFQGEEAKVVVVSLVRSNDMRKCGFLKTSNRINVLLSRARHGMYIIGNSDTARPVPMWAEVLSILERSNNIGPSLALCCPRHKDTPIEVSVPDDFARFAPEGGSAELLATATCPVHLAYNPAKSAATIRNAVSFAMSHAHHVLRTALGLAHIVDDASYRVRCHVICYHAQSAAQRCWPVDINAHLFVESPLRNINRYSRIVRRAMIDEATKKFIVWANMEFIPLVTRMQAVEAEFREKAAGSTSPGHLLQRPLHLKGTRDHQISQIKPLTQNDEKYRTIMCLRRDIKKYLKQVDEDEQPFGRIFDLVQDARRHRGLDTDLHSKVDILQVRNRLLTTVLLIRCDYTILLTFLADLKSRNSADSPALQVDLSANRDECDRLIAESHAKHQPANCVEGHLYWVRFLVLERSSNTNTTTTTTTTIPTDPPPPPSTQPLTQLLETATHHLQHAHTLCAQHPGQTASLVSEVTEAEQTLLSHTSTPFYLPVSNAEKAAVYMAMARDFRGTGHWYY